MLGAGGVHRRPLDVVGMVARPRHRGDDAVIDLLLVELELVLAVERRGADEGVDALPLGMGERLGRPVDVLRAGAGEAADDRALDDLGDLRDGLEIAVGGDRKARLDDVDAHLVEELGDLDLLVERHRGAGRLLAVAQGGVEDDDAFLGGRGLFGGGHCLVFLKPCPRRAAGVKGGSRFRLPLSARPARRQPTLRGA